MVNKQIKESVDGMICSLSIGCVVGGIEMLVEDNELQNHLITTAVSQNYGDYFMVEKKDQWLAWRSFA